LRYVKLLIKRGAKVIAGGQTTALHKAVSVVRSGEEGAANEEIIKWLLDNYPDMLNNQDAAAGNTALHIAIHHRGMNAVPILKILRQKGANTSIKNTANQTPLEFAKAKYGDTSVAFKTIETALTSPI
jgi:ankyrin repeat protein